MKRVLFISSTGGHLTELLQLEPLFQHYEASLVTEKTKSNASLKQKYGKRMHYLAYGTKQHLLPYLFIFAWNIIKSFALLSASTRMSSLQPERIPRCRCVLSRISSKRK